VNLIITGGVNITITMEKHSVKHGTKKALILLIFMMEFVFSILLKQCCDTRTEIDLYQRHQIMNSLKFLFKFNETRDTEKMLNRLTQVEVTVKLEESVD
jgi:hypothetical protein